MELNRELERIYSNVLPSVNIFTPVVLDYIKVNNHICELSKSHRDVRHDEMLYGVSTITNKNGEYKYNNDLSRCFKTIKEALNFIEDIKNGIN